MRVLTQFFVLLCVGFSLSACSEPPVGSQKRPFTMYFVPSIDAQSIASTIDILEKHVEKQMSQKLYGKDTGFYVKSSIPTSYIAVIEAFGTGRADFSALNTFSYILAKDIKKYPIEAFLSVKHHDGAVTYKGQIITRVDSGINKLEDLKGKKFAFVDPASTSGFILPSKLFKDKKIELGETVFAQKHDNVVTMVYQKQVDAGATYYTTPIKIEKNGKYITRIQDARERVLTQFPDVEEKIKIIGFTQEIPTEPWVIRSNLYKDPKMQAKVKKALTETLISFANSPEGKKNLAEVYSIHGVMPTTDERYKEIRNLITSKEINIEEILKDRSKTKRKKKKM